MLDNILASKLYRPGSVAYVSRSGGMSNELNNIISRTTDGVYEGVAIGGDRYKHYALLVRLLVSQAAAATNFLLLPISKLISIYYCNSHAAKPFETHKKFLLTNKIMTLIGIESNFKSVEKNFIFFFFFFLFCNT